MAHCKNGDLFWSATSVKTFSHSNLTFPFLRSNGRVDLQAMISGVKALVVDELVIYMYK